LNEFHVTVLARLHRAIENTRGDPEVSPLATIVPPRCGEEPASPMRQEMIAAWSSGEANNFA
jgi:hypothetical protein